MGKCVGRNTKIERNLGYFANSGGRGGIRTHGTLAGTPVFKTGALNHSATLPAQEFQSLSVGLARTQCERGPDVYPIPSIWKKPSDEGVAFGQARTLHFTCAGKITGGGIDRKAFASGSSGGC